MARDLDKRLKETERLLKQGKAAAATRELRVLAEESAREPLVLNRIGDFLARVGQKDEALALFDRIAEEFSRSGFYPQAVAVLKKILRIESHHLNAVLLLGEVYVKQKVVAEARAFLLSAGDAYLRAKQLDAARQVYEKILALDPKEPLHRVRLAETRVLLGDPAGASADLIAAGEELLASGRPADGEKAFRRAGEISPDRPEPISGTARCLGRQGRADEAVALLEAASARPGVGPLLTGDLFVLYEQSGRGDKSRAFLTEDRAEALDDGALEEMVKVHAERGQSAEAWKRLDPLLERWAEYERFDRLLPLLERLARVEGQDVPALERLHRAQRLTGDRDGLGRTLENLVRAYWAHSMYAQASAALEELREVAPRSPLVAESISRRSLSDAPPSAPAVVSPQVSEARVGAPVSEPAAPAVPASSADREFVARHLAEAEAFRKYDLFEKAMEQVREVTRRFPGHAEGHEKAVELLRGRNDGDALRRALVAWAVARHASGDLAGALSVAEEAQRHGPLPDSERTELERLDLLGSGVKREFRPSAPVIRTPPPPPPREGQIVAAVPPEIGDETPEIEIVFDDGTRPALDGPEGMIPAPMGDAGIADAPSDSIEEIAFFLEQGMRAEAMERLATLRKQGFTGERIEELERRAALVGTTGAQTAIPRPPAHGDEIDVHSFSEALETEPEAPPTPEAPAAAEQGIDDVFAAFKEQVAAEVGSEDFRTHYDLGIAYKEMGLLEDAMSEFETATRSPDKFREACTMLGLCHRETGDLDQAARWYRTALEDPSASPEDLLGIRYDLAEVLAAQGDFDGALQMFGLVLAVDPNYRDVLDRVTALRSHRQL
jgi:tetratricopeptide (TPR) repeat protein